MRKTPIRPRKLQRGDLIGLVSPASRAEAGKVQAGTKYLEGRGFRVKHGAHLGEEWGYLAGTDANRAADFNDMILDPEVKAIFAVRGGYGTPRILDQIDYRAIQRHPKIIVGYSDITALQLAILRQTGLVTFSGPMPAVEFAGTPDPFTEAHFWPLLEGGAAGMTLVDFTDEKVEVSRAGEVEGPLMGGNLSLLTSIVGTPYSPSYAGALMLLEEVDEYPHRLDRMFAQLRHAGVLDQLGGLMLGQFTLCGPKDSSKPHLTATAVLADYTAALKIPVATNFPYGHVPRKITLPIGARARLDTRQGFLKLLEETVV